jgi:hypothetical protein
VRLAHHVRRPSGGPFAGAPAAAAPARAAKEASAGGVFYCALSCGALASLPACFPAVLVCPSLAVSAPLLRTPLREFIRRPLLAWGALGPQVARLLLVEQIWELPPTGSESAAMPQPRVTTINQSISPAHSVSSLLDCCLHSHVRPVAHVSVSTHSNLLKSPPAPISCSLRHPPSGEAKRLSVG